MVFLNPAVLFGLLAASIPVLIHLLNLRKLKKIDFSTLTFLKELQKNKIRKIKIKQLLLLALRVAIILFIVLAFARPTLEGVSIAGVTSAAKTTAVFILDDSYSMSVVDNNGSYFNQAKETVKELLDQLQEGDEAALILLSENSEAGKTEVQPTSNFSEIKNRINELQVSYYSGILNEAVIKSSEIISQSQNFNKEIYLLSDFQKGRLFEQNTLSDLSELLNENVKLYILDFSGKKVFNIGIDDLEINTQIFEKGKPVNFSVTITNYSGDPAENIVVSLFISSERSAQQSVNLQPGETKIIRMESVVNASGFIDVFAETEDDDMLQDNQSYTNFYIPEEISVALFTDKMQDAQFVNLALTSSGENRAMNVTVKNSDQMAAYNLNRFDIIILIGTDGSNYAGRLNSFVENGGGLLLFPGSDNNSENFNKFLSELNLPIPAGTAGKLSSEENSIEFENIDFNHPVFQNIFSKEKKNVESPEIYFHYKINTGGKGKNIISLIDGSSFLSEYKKGDGKIFLFNSSPVLSWSNFPIKSIFAPLINKSVFYLTSEDQTETNHLVGSIVNINISDQSMPQVKIVKPDNSEEYINVEEQNNPDYITYSKTAVPGNYHIFSSDKLINDFSVNINPVESVTEYLDDEEFQDYLNRINFKGHFIKVDKDENLAEVILQSRFGSELWNYFLLTAIILALIEMAVARSSRKDMIDLK